LFINLTPFIPLPLIREGGQGDRLLNDWRNRRVDKWLIESLLSNEILKKQVLTWSLTLMVVAGGI